MSEHEDKPQEVEQESAIQAHARKLLDELKQEREKNRLLTEQLNSVSMGGDKFKDAYINLVKQNLINDVMRKANVTKAGKAMVTSHVNTLLKAGEVDGLPTFDIDGFESVDALSEAIKTDESFAVCIGSNMGGAQFTGSSQETHGNKKQEAPIADLFGLR